MKPTAVLVHRASAESSSRDSLMPGSTSGDPSPVPRPDDVAQLILEAGRASELVDA